jgi:hypothetical protein
MNKGYSIGFLIVLLVVVLGLYVAITGFISSREAHRAQAAAAASTQAALPSRTPTRVVPTPTETVMVIPTPVTGLTITMTAMASAGATEPAAPTEPPPRPPTQAPIVRPTDTPAAVVQPPTPVPAPAYQFRLAGPPSPDPGYQICCYVYGTVKDAAGNGLEGVQVQAFNEWASLPPALTKGGGELGKYDIPIGREQVTWYVMIVDQAGNQISSQVQLQWNPDEANGFRIDWQRTY